MSYPPSPPPPPDPYPSGPSPSYGGSMGSPSNGDGLVLPPTAPSPGFPPGAQPGAPGFAPGSTYPGAGQYPNGVAFLPDAPFSTVTLVLGIIAVASIPIALFFPFLMLLAPVAMIFGFVGRSRVKHAPPNSYRTGKLTAGWVLGIIGTVLLIIGIVGIIFLISLISSLSESGG